MTDTNELDRRLEELRVRRQAMTIQEFVEDVEMRHFRTGQDWGANPNALFIWNQVREYAGMEKLTKEDLIRRHADDIGYTYEEMVEAYRKMDLFQFLVSRGLNQQEALRQSGIVEDDNDSSSSSTNP